MGKYELYTKIKKEKASAAKINKYVFLMPLIFIIFCFSLVYFLKDSNAQEEIENTNISFKLKGSKEENIELNTTYNDLGFDVYEDGNLLDIELVDYTISHNINSYVLGKYTINYAVRYKFKDYKLSRVVNVVDSQPPLLTVDNEFVEVFECKKNSKNNLEFLAVDNYDGVLTDKVKSKKVGEEYVLSVSDSSKNETVVKVPIKYVEDPSVVIKLKGKELVYVSVGDTYKDSGYELYNGCGKSIKGEVLVDNSVNTKVPGTYRVTYTANKNGKKVSSKFRTVIVYDNKKIPVVTDEGVDKTVYLTFDDGPGRYTRQLLDILKKYDVKATFFVTNQFKDYVPLIKDIHKEGHGVAVHTLTHKWSIYRSVETYMKDFNDMNNIIEKYTGKRSKIFRFPGGSSNTISKGYSTGVVKAIANRTNELGYVYFDWNVDSNDAGGASRNQIVNNVISGIKKKKNSVVLMHDIKKNTLDAIEEILIYGKSNGYTFKVLTVDSPTCKHGIRN